MNSATHPNPWTARGRSPRKPDTTYDWGTQRIYFNSFQRTPASEWYVIAEKHRLTIRGWVSCQTAYIGSGIAWTERQDFRNFACPSDTYNALNACISVITAGEENMRGF